MKIICFGDSNTYGYDPRGYWGGRYDHPWPEILSEMLGCIVENWGENGRMIPVNAQDYLVDADLLIVMLGTNDLLQGASPEAVCDRMEQFLHSLDRERVLLLAPPTMKLGAWVPDQGLVDDSNSLSDHYQTMARRLDIRFVDAMQGIPLAYDGVHLTEEGHRAFAERLIKHLHKGEFA